MHHPTDRITLTTAFFYTNRKQLVDYIAYAVRKQTNKKTPKNKQTTTTKNNNNHTKKTPQTPPPKKPKTTKNKQKQKQTAVFQKVT